MSTLSPVTQMTPWDIGGGVTVPFWQVAPLPPTVLPSSILSVADHVSPPRRPEIEELGQRGESDALCTREGPDLASLPSHGCGREKDRWCNPILVWI